MKRVVFLDLSAPRAYSDEILRIGANGVGGTQTSVVRLARALSQRLTIAVVQEARRPGESTESGGVAWLALSEAGEALKAADVIVLLPRSAAAIREYRHVNERAKFIVWNHDWQPRASDRRSPRIKLRCWTESTRAVRDYRAGRASAVTVSDAHAANLKDFFRQSFLPARMSAGIPVRRIYNSVQALRPAPDLPYDPDQLIYFSAAWKGLDLVLKAFDAAVSAIPQLKLLVASPGYATRDNGFGALDYQPKSDRVQFVGSLDPAPLFREVQRSLCVFYPANRVPETFGLVFAESHAVGTPVLAHPFGAAPEILDGSELVAATDYPKIIETLRSWRSGGRPAVQRNPAFDIENIADEWYAHLNA